MLSCVSMETHIGLDKGENVIWDSGSAKNVHVNNCYHNSQNEIQGQLLQSSVNTHSSMLEYDDFVTDEDEFESDYEDEVEWDEEPESTSTLLAFAASATNDIRTYFNRNQGSEDYCDVFEDRFKSVQSGRELYYADLLAEIGSERKHERFKHPPNKCTTPANGHTITTPNGKTVRCHLPHHGQLDVNFGLGPFQELFDSVLRKSLIQDRQSESIAVLNKIPSITESTLHKFPESLWDDSKHHQTLDFEDLLADWTTDNSAYDV